MNDKTKITGHGKKRSHSYTEQVIFFIPSGFIDYMHSFDNTFFNTSPKEALSMDPQQFHIMEVSANDRILIILHSYI